MNVRIFLSRAMETPSVPLETPPVPNMRVRPFTSHFEPRSLIELWVPSAQLKNPGWRWDGTDYVCSSRSSYGDDQLLMKHKPALHPLLVVAPTGFPSHADVRSVLMWLDTHHRALACDSSQTWRIATESADRWRIMRRHIYNRKKDNIDGPAEILELVNMIRLPTEEPPSATRSPRFRREGSTDSCSLAEDSTAVVAALTVEDVSRMMPDFDDAATDDGDDVTITAAFCNCPECRKERAASTSDPQAAQGSGRQPATEPIMAHSPAIPSPGSGRQRKESMGAAHSCSKSKRLRVKTTVGDHRAPKKIQLPAIIVSRKNKLNSYLLGKGNTYICGMSGPTARDTLKTLQELINTASVSTKPEALAWLQGQRSK